MPWENRGLMSLREEFIFAVEAKIDTISSLSRKYNISRKTAYKWLKRYLEEGKFGLYNRSKRPSHMPSRLDTESVELILSKRAEYPAWGAKKLRAGVDQ